MSVGTDLKALLVGHTFANNANLSGEPNKLMIYEDIGVTTYGKIQINEVNRLTPEETHSLRTTPYRIGLTIEYDGQADDTKIMALVDEIQAAFDTNNQSQRIYYYTIESYEFTGIVRMGQIRMIIGVRREFETK